MLGEEGVFEVAETGAFGVMGSGEEEVPKAEGARAGFEVVDDCGVGIVEAGVRVRGHLEVEEALGGDTFFIDEAGDLVRC